MCQFSPSLIFLAFSIAFCIDHAREDQKNIVIAGTPFDTTQCSTLLPKSVVAEIQGYQTLANNIFAATRNTFKGKTYDQLEILTDTFGPRPSGSLGLEKALDYVLQQLKNQGLTNVREEKVVVPKITSGNQFGYMVEPRVQKLGLTASGFSPSTSELGLSAEIILIPSPHFFMTNKANVRGKIAVMDYFIRDPDDKIFSLVEAAGAVAILYRVFVSFSIYTEIERAGPMIHIPVGFLTNEDVDLFARLNARGSTIKLFIKIENIVTMAKSRNLVADFPGRLKPNEVVIISGHADSWHFSEGAQDDGVGVAFTLEVPRLLKSLGLNPRRTIRSVFFTGEEPGYNGSIAYIKAHANELSRYSAMIEPDRGCFKPRGYLFGQSSPQFGCILHEIMKLQEKTVGAKHLDIGDPDQDIASDVRQFATIGIPAAELNGDDGRYFWYHHTKADTMSIVNSNQLDKCLALLATTTYILADLEQMVPRN